MPRRAAWRALARAADAAVPPAPHPSLATVTPRVPPLETTTAAAWLQARANLPLALRGALFRRRAVRLVLEDGSTKRVAAGGAVPPGAALAVPASALAAAPPRRRPPPPALSPASAALAADLPSRTLLTTPHFCVVAKRAGEHTQSGGPPAAAALDAAAAAAWPGARLVHRLDVGVSGAVALARTAAAAAWLAAALARPAAAGDVGVAAATTITKRYLALVDAHPYGLDLGPGARGVVDGPLPLTPAAGGAARKAVAAARAASGAAPPPPAPTRAVTEWRVLAQRGGWALLAMRPVTGRKHQLRKVAAGALGAPVAGDDRYGVTRSPRGRALDAATGRPAGALMLHCCELTVRAGAARAVARAPLPPYFVAALRALGWRGWAAKYGRARGVVRGGWDVEG